MSATSPRPRLATSADAVAIHALERHFPGDRLQLRAIRRLLRVPSARIWVLGQGDELVAALVLLLRRNSRHARIYSLVVAPEARGRGLAQCLLDAAEAFARTTRLSSLTLEVRADNQPARNLYRRRGYSIESELPGYYDDGAPALRLRLRFEEAAPPDDRSGT